MAEEEPKPLNILIADDSDTVRRLIIDSLESSPFAVSITESGDGIDACRQLLSGDFDIAFVDVIMPGVDGLSVLKLLHKRKSQTFVVIISNESDETHRQMARQFRAYEYLKKPFTQRQIIQMLENFHHMLASYKALIVDDSGTLRTIVGKILKKSFFKIDFEEAGDGESAVEVCKDRKFDLVFLDINMPGISGIDALRQIREFDPEIKPIIMTANSDFRIKNDLKVLNIEDILYKPFSVFDVDVSLHNIFNIHQPSLNYQTPQVVLSA